MTVEIGAKLGHLLCRPNFLIGREECEIGPRRANRVDQGELAPEPLGDDGESRIECPIASDPVGCRDPINSPHDEKRLAPDSGILAGKERFGNRHLRRESRLLHGEFLNASQARRNPSRGGGAQHEPLFAVERAA